MQCNFRMTKAFWVMEISSHSQFDRHMCTQIGGIYIIKLRALSGDVFSSAWALNPSYAFVYLSATFHCLLSTCVNQSCETEWCVDSHASVSIWLSQQLNGEMPEAMPLDKWAGSAVAGEGNALPAEGMWTDERAEALWRCYGVMMCTSRLGFIVTLASWRARLCSEVWLQKAVSESIFPSSNTRPWLNPQMLSRPWSLTSPHLLYSLFTYSWEGHQTHSCIPHFSRGEEGVLL